MDPTIVAGVIAAGASGIVGAVVGSVTSMIAINRQSRNATAVRRREVSLRAAQEFLRAAQEVERALAHQFHEAERADYAERAAHDLWYAQKHVWLVSDRRTAELALDFANVATDRLWRPVEGEKPWEAVSAQRNAFVDAATAELAR